ncbi:MAG TPA: hypothetical protein VKU00_07530, partial [Chthonomonadaceae bacterium]|nr:hypothetical protein [Chthonomonadaceae bacterium]
VILAASSAGTSGNDMPLKASSYVPLTNQLLSYLGQGAVSHRNLQQDDPLFLSLPLTDANKSVRVTDPDNRTVSQNSVLDARGVTFSYASTHRAGLYQVAVVGSQTTDAFAVGLPSSESDLAYADPSVSAAQSGVQKDHLTVVNTPAQLRAVVNRNRYGAEIWRWLIGPVIFLLFLESFLAQHFGRRG